MALTNLNILKRPSFLIAKSSTLSGSTAFSNLNRKQSMTWRKKQFPNTFALSALFLMALWHRHGTDGWKHAHRQDRAKQTFCYILTSPFARTHSRRIHISNSRQANLSPCPRHPQPPQSTVQSTPRPLPQLQKNSLSLPTPSAWNPKPLTHQQTIRLLSAAHFRHVHWR